MVKLKFKTKDYSTPQGKQNLYFCCHPEDFAPCFEPICRDIFQFQDCAIWYKGDPTEAWEEDRMEAQLGLMQLFVVPVTSKFLEQDNTARQDEFSFAVKHHIPVLPLVQEDGLETEFNRICGEWQCLDKNASTRDITAIPYDQKLNRYLSSVLVSEEDEEKIRDAFCTHIFMSYRKKDRREAQELMSMIHKYDLCRDVAIWYDEFLIPGENYNQTIMEALSKSSAVIFVITPHVLEPGNYVMTAEYPDAVQTGKPILPAEMEKTDQTQLRQSFHNIPDSVSPYEQGTFFQVLMTDLKDENIQVNNDPSHLYYIGLAYLNGINVETDYKRAIQLLERAAEQGNIDAQDKLGDCYVNGNGVPVNYEEAVKWYRKAAEQGDLYGQYNLGACYHYGQGIAQDYEQAVHWYMLSAEDGSPVPQNNIGVCFENGLGVHQDYEKAAQWYLKAAKQGYAMAQSNIGALYMKGMGVPQDFDKAVEWLKKAADQGFSYAQYNLSLCFSEGCGVDQDDAKAVEWCRKSAEQGLIEAQCDLGDYYSIGKGVEQDYTQASKWYKKAAEQGNAKAQYNLGHCYYNGQGVPHDYEQAVMWYTKAAEQGLMYAQVNLAYCYEMGLGVPPDLWKAAEWYMKAKAQENQKPES